MNRESENIHIFVQPAYQTSSVLNISAKKLEMFINMCVSDPRNIGHTEKSFVMQ